MRPKYQDETSLAEVHRLRRTGIPIPVEENEEFPESPPLGILIRPVRRCSAIELNPCATVYVIHLRIVSNLPGPFAISSYRLEVPWGHTTVLLADPRESYPPSNSYRFLGDYPMSFGRNEVLNRLDDVRRTLSRGYPLQGVLLWYADEPIPENYLHGEDIAAFVFVVNQWGREYPGTLSLYIDRTRTLAPKRPRIRARRNITGKPVEAMSEELSPGLGTHSISEGVGSR
jgi:hypothetical protein